MPETPLRPVPRHSYEAPDPNPLLPCQECGDGERFKTARDGDWLTSKDPEIPYLCPDCAADHEDIQ